MINSEFINIIVTSNNIVGIIPILTACKYGNCFEILLISGSVLASIMMHISETKHNLPGTLRVSLRSVM